MLEWKRGSSKGNFARVRACVRRSWRACRKDYSVEVFRKSGEYLGPGWLIFLRLLPFTNLTFKIWFQPCQRERRTGEPCKHCDEDWKTGSEELALSPDYHPLIIFFLTSGESIFPAFSIPLGPTECAAKQSRRDDAPRVHIILSPLRIGFIV